MRDRLEDLEWNTVRPNSAQMATMRFRRPFCRRYPSAKTHWGPCCGSLLWAIVMVIAVTIAIATFVTVAIIIAIASVMAMAIVVGMAMVCESVGCAYVCMRLGADGGEGLRMQRRPL